MDNENKLPHTINENLKKFSFHIEPDTHARLYVQLKYDNISQSLFFRLLIKGYLENNDYIRNYIDEALAERNSIRVKKNKKNDRKEAQKQLEDFSLDENEISNIFDILESENPDL